MSLAKVREMENELRHYWQVMQCPIGMSLSEYRDELEVLSDMTDWPVLKAACDRGAARFTTTGKLAGRAIEERRA